MTFQEYSEQFMRIHLQNKRPNTQKNYNKYLGYINTVFGNRKINSITAIELDDYFLSLKNRGLKINSIKIYRDVFNLVFDSAEIKRVITDNPMKALDFEFKDNIKYQPKSASVETLQIIINSFQMPYYVYLIILGIMTGLRRGELCGLQWKNIDFDNDLIHITNAIDDEGNLGPTKTISTIRPIRMYPNLKFVMQKIKDYDDHNKEVLGTDYKDNDFVVCKFNGEPLNINTVSKTMYEKSKTWHVHFTMHMLRHTFATNLKTANIKDLQNLLGHANPDMSLSYQDYIDLDKSTVELLNKSFDPKKYLK